MQIKFKTNAAALQEALAIVGIVSPRPITPQGGSGYLFVVRDNRCYLYSRDATRVARADIAVEEVEGTGAFIYPAEYVGLLGRAGDGDIEFTATSEGEVHRVSFQSSSGAKDSRTTYDPRLLAPCDKDFEAATGERAFPVGVLKEALRQAKPFILEADKKMENQEHLKSVQVYDGTKPEWASGNGVLYAANGTTAIYFQSDAFTDKGLAIHGQHLSAVTSFLGRASGEVTMRRGTNMTFAVDSKGRVLGWTHHEKMHGRFHYYGLHSDAFVYDVPVSAFLSALKYMQSGLGKRDKIKVAFSHADSSVSFSALESNAETASFPVPVIPHEGSKESNVEFFANINHIMAMVADAKGDRLMFRIAVLPKNEQRPKETYMLRTMDSFLMDADGKVVPGSAESKPEGAYQCQVTRFVPSYQ